MLKNKRKKSLIFVNKQAEQYGFKRVIETKIMDIKYLQGCSLPKYKKFSERGDIKKCKEHIKINSKKSILRSAVISADRVVSALSAEGLESRIQRQDLDSLIDDIFDLGGGNLSSHIEDCLDNFRINGDKNRNFLQSEAAKKLVNVQNTYNSSGSGGVAVLQGHAGCGKTKVALEWAQNSNAQKIIWIAPRVLVCLGLYKELSSEKYLADAKIEILTSEYQLTKQCSEEENTKECDRFSGDIVITTIDQVINMIITHRQICSFTDFLNYHVIFDEFHELIKIPGINLLFSELIEAKKMRNKEAKTLLISATPHPYFITEFLDIDKDDIIKMETFNRSRYKINLESYDETRRNSPLVEETYGCSTFVIHNTAIGAQLGFVKNQEKENAILFHSQFIANDKKRIFDDIYSAFGKDGVRNFDILRAGPIVQASLDDLQLDLDIWLEHFNNERPHSGKYCYGKTPMQTFQDSKKLAVEKNIVKAVEYATY